MYSASSTCYNSLCRMLLSVYICLLMVVATSAWTPLSRAGLPTASPSPSSHVSSISPTFPINVPKSDVKGVRLGGQQVARSMQEVDGEGNIPPHTVQTVLVVSTDRRSDHFATVQAAVDAVPMWNYVRWIIYIKAGTYYGKVLVPEGKNYITFLGEGAETTVLTFNIKACDRQPDGSEYGILDSPSVIVEASHFVAKGITFENSSPKPDDLDFNSQAPAIRISGDSCAFYNCNFLSWQDTLFADQGRHYYKDCRIEGNVDFILGYARAVFENCTIHSRDEGFITAQSRWCGEDCPGTANSAFVILSSNLTGSGLTYLGRPWREYAKVLFINTTMGDHIVPEGWIDWLTESGPLFPHDDVYFAETGSNGPGANASARVSWSHQLTKEEAKPYSNVILFLEGDTWLETPPSLDALMETDLLREEGWGSPISQDGYRNKKFPPRRWKSLGTRPIH